MSDVPDNTTPVDFSCNAPITSASERGEKTLEVLEPTSRKDILTDKDDRQPSKSCQIVHVASPIREHLNEETTRDGKTRSIPEEVGNCRVPTCSVCLYSEAPTRQFWRGNHPSKRKKVNRCKIPLHHVVSVDQLVSLMPGVIVQMTGFFLATKCYKFATVFVKLRQPSKDSLD